MSDSTSRDATIPNRIHPEWEEEQGNWNWLYDSWEGGLRYRDATYGSMGKFPAYNLFRHKHEMPPDDFGWTLVRGRIVYDGWVDDFEARRLRTPVPDWVSSAVELHNAKIYTREVARKGSAGLEAFWKDVDGRGTPIDAWMSGTIAPLFLVLGQIDVQVEHPQDPDDFEVVSREDERKAGTRGAVATYILPQNMRWWRLNRKGQYVECIVREETDEHGEVFRHWTQTHWTLYTPDNKVIGGSTEHGYGRVPIVRSFFRRKPRSRNVGIGGYERVAELMREYYNRDSELILSDTLQAHPLLQGPDDLVKADGTVTIGPKNLLPKVKSEKGGTVYYEGFEFVEPPKDGAESIRQNKSDMRDEADRSAYLTKPAGAAGTNGSTVSQSGASKRIDQSQGNDYLARVATALETLEKNVAFMVEVVLSDGANPDPNAATKIAYPKTFDLYSAPELTAAAMSFQTILGSAGGAPKTETKMLQAIVRSTLQGLQDEEYRVFDEEIEEVVADRAKDHEAMREASLEASLQAAQNEAESNQADTPASGGQADEPDEEDR